MSITSDQILAEIKNVIAEAVKVSFNGQQFLLKVDVNEDPNKKGVKVQFVPTEFGTMSGTEQDDIAIELGAVLERGLTRYGMSLERDRNLKDKSIIGFFIYIEYFERIIRQVLKQQEKEVK